MKIKARLGSFKSRVSVQASDHERLNASVVGYRAVLIWGPGSFTGRIIGQQQQQTITAKTKQKTKTKTKIKWKRSWRETCRKITTQKIFMLYLFVRCSMMLLFSLSNDTTKVNRCPRRAFVLSTHDICLVYIQRLSCPSMTFVLSCPHMTHL